MAALSRGSTDRWLQELREAAGGVADDGQRGEYLLRVSSAVRNLKHDNIADLIGVILETGAWRSYTYPNGDHYEFRAREFDYFLAQQDIDPRMVRDAAAYTDDNELRVLLVESSLDREGEDRRSVDEIVAAYPLLKPWLDKYGLRTLGAYAMYKSPSARERVSEGAGGNESVNRRSWQVAVFNDGSVAEAIVRKLRREPELLEEVVSLLSQDVRTTVTSNVTSERRCQWCGETVTGKRLYCNQDHRNRASRARRAAS